VVGGTAALGEQLGPGGLQGQAVGSGCRVIRRARPTRAGVMAMSLHWIVPMVPWPGSGPLMVGAARMRLNAIMARTSQAPSQ